MDWESTLIGIYVFVHEDFGSELYALGQRQSNNHSPRFTDEEVVTIYLFGLIKGRRTLRDIHTYVVDHLSTWFPDLPSYGGYVQRLNRLSDVFAALTEKALEAVSQVGVIASRRLVDSFPIILAHAKRSARARVAPELADKGYCSSKNLYYYGVKVHVVATSRPGGLPVPDRISADAASSNDLTAIRPVLPELHGGVLIGDKAYASRTLRADLMQAQNLELITPKKKAKGQARLSAADQMYSTAVSALRQPIESLFNWVEEKTGIQMASKVRSYDGLMVHVFGRLAAAMFLLALNS
jgi:hypothetical protein